jgi:hypothetical protein
LKSSAKEIDRILAALEEHPLRLAQHLSLPADKLTFSPASKVWSPAQILAHLRACADLWTHSMYAMLAENEPMMSDINERKWAQVARYEKWPFADLLRGFSDQRATLIRVLRALPPESWERSALIAGRRHTIFTQARRMDKHEAEHLEQIEALLK